MPDETGELRLLDPPSGAAGGTQPPAMANAAGMLVSTLDDFWAFVSMLVAEGRHEGQQLLSPGAVGAMTRDHLTAAQRAGQPIFLGEHGGWGYGMAAPGPSRGEPPAPSGYGWNGGTGTVWTTDPDHGLTGILLSTTGHDLAATAGALRGLLGGGLRRAGRAERGGSGRPQLR